MTEPSEPSAEDTASSSLLVRTKGIVAVPPMVAAEFAADCLELFSAEARAASELTMIASVFIQGDLESARARIMAFKSEYFPVPFVDALERLVEQSIANPPVMWDGLLRQDDK